MKKLLTLVLSIVLLSTTFFWSSCLKTDEEGGWAKDEKESYDQVINLQDEIGDNLDDWLQTMDSLDAIEEAYQAFINSNNVSSATINSQGITVQYDNGMRGGLFLKGKLLDYKKSTSTNSGYDDPNASDNLKSLVNRRKVLQMDAAYSEFSYYTDQVHNINTSNLSRVGMSITEYLKDDQVTVDRLTQLTGYGIVDMSGHGLAWPNDTFITDIYYLTGETVNENTSKKYWDELKTGNIPVMKINLLNINKYFVSVDFISNYNDFSKDTVFFYGGFCYSFLGGWPDIIDGFGDGAYLGFDWAVQGYWCANWDIKSLALMSDTSKLQPKNLEEWMQDESVDKSYNEGSRTVRIHYAGDGNLKLWDKEGVSLMALSPDGKPVSQPGEPGVAYPFKCTVVSSVTNIEYSWDIGNGSAPVVASNAVNITWSETGNYLLQVTATNKDNGSVIGKASLSVVIGEIETGLVAFMKTCNTVTVMFDKGSTLMHYPYADINWVIEDMSWNGLSFSGTTTNSNGSVYSIEGLLSGDGQKISFTVNGEWTDINNDRHMKDMMEVANYPLIEFVPPGNFGGWANYEVDPPGDVSYVTDFSAEATQDGNTTYFSMADFDWTQIDYLKVHFDSRDKIYTKVKNINE